MARFKLNEIIPIKIDKEQRYETYQFLQKSQVDEPQRIYYTQDKHNDIQYHVIFYLFARLYGRYI